MGWKNSSLPGLREIKSSSLYYCTVCTCILNLTILNQTLTLDWRSDPKEVTCFLHLWLLNYQRLHCGSFTTDSVAERSVHRVALLLLVWETWVSFVCWESDFFWFQLDRGLDELLSKWAKDSSFIPAFDNWAPQVIFQSFTLNRWQVGSSADYASGHMVLIHLPPIFCNSHWCTFQVCRRAGIPNWLEEFKDSFFRGRVCS